MTYVAPIPFDYNALNDGLAALFDVLTDLTGSSLSGTAQDAGQSPFFPSSDPDDGSTLAKITYNITGVAGLGWDEWRIGYDATIKPPGDTYVNPQTGLVDLGSVIYSSEGNRKIVVSVKCECWDLKGSGAIQYIERIKARINLPSFAQALRDLRVAQNNVSATRDMSYFSDSSTRVSAAQFELVLNAAEAAVDDPLTTIQKLGKPTFIPITGH